MEFTNRNLYAAMCVHCQEFGYDGLEFCYEILNTYIKEYFERESARACSLSYEGVFELIEVDEPEFTEKFRKLPNDNWDTAALFFIGNWMCGLYEYHGVTGKQIYEHFSPDLFQWLYDSYDVFHTQSYAYVCAVIMEDCWGKQFLKNVR
ncbi:hypothetical protein AGMMS49975_23380 [Clostridia bacterium]|nr:hypothetical protein AGMMS49975_23380 [Clostridia bacterium]